MRQFFLWRKEDVSGKSGTGLVGEGVVFDNGRVVFQWLSNTRSVVFFDSMEDMMEIHGHEGRTIWDHMGLQPKRWQIELLAGEQPPKRDKGSPGFYTNWHALHRVDLFLEKLWGYIDGTQAKGSVAHFINPTPVGGLSLLLDRKLTEGMTLLAQVDFDWAGDIVYLRTWVHFEPRLHNLAPEVWKALTESYEEPYFGIGLAVKLIGEHFLYELPEDNVTSEEAMNNEHPIASR